MVLFVVKNVSMLKVSINLHGFLFQEFLKKSSQKEVYIRYVLHKILIHIDQTNISHCKMERKVEDFLFISLCHKPTNICYANTFFLQKQGKICTMQLPC